MRRLCCLCPLQLAFLQIQLRDDGSGVAVLLHTRGQVAAAEKAWPKEGLTPGLPKEE